MEPPDYLEIPLAYAKVALRLALCVGFVLGAIAVWRAGNPILGATAGFFFAAMGFFGCRLVFDRTAGLILSPAGMVINRKVGLGGSVPWTDVTDLTLSRFGNDWQLLVGVEHPDRYTGAHNAFYRFFNSMSSSLFNTPVRVNTGLLNCDRDDLLALARQMWAKYGKPPRAG